MGTSPVPPAQTGHEEKVMFSAERMASDAIAAGGFGLVGIALFTMTVLAGTNSSRSGWIWGLGLPALLVFGGIAFALIRRYYDRPTLLKLSATGLKAQGLGRPLRWEEIDDVEFDERYGPRLLVHIRRNANHEKSPQAIALKRLKRPQRRAAFEAVMARVSARRAALGLGETRTERDMREVAEFDEKLRTLTPSAWSANVVVALNVAVWLVQVLSGVPVMRPTSEVLYLWGGNSASAVLLDGEPWRLFTATVLHGGLMHLALNMLGLWAPGRQLVRQIGHSQFLFVYLAGALCGSAASLHFSAQASVSVGASGAVFGVLGALVASSWKYRKELPAINHKQIWSGPGLFIVYALVQGFGSARVDNAAHVGGLLCGAALGLLLVARFDVKRAQERTSQASLGVLLATAAVVIGVMTTPLPRTWHAPLFEAHGVLRNAGPEFERLSRGLERFKGRRDDDPELRAYLERDLLRGCAGIQRDLNTIRVPAWEPVAQAASLLGRMCGLMSEAARVGLAAKTPQEHAAAEKRGAAIVVELRALAAQMKALNPAGKEKKQ